MSYPPFMVDNYFQMVDNYPKTRSFGHKAGTTLEKQKLWITC
jgi:hypothetical protein